MKFSTLLLTQLANPSVEARRPDSTDDIGFNLHGGISEIAQLEKYHLLGLKFFRLHQKDLRSRFIDNWGGNNGRFEKEVRKLTKTFNRCGTKHLDPKSHENQVLHITSDDLKIDNEGSGDVDVEDTLEESPTTFSNSTSNEDRKRRKRRELSPGELIDGKLDHHNPGHRILHVLRNMQRWAEAYLPECRNQKKIIQRYEKYLTRFKAQLAKNPVFGEQKALKRFNAPAERTPPGDGELCGYIFRDYGLHGDRRTLYRNRPVNNLHDTDFGGDELSSMQPVPGCYIRAFEHQNQEGLSSICNDPNGCGVMHTWKNGALENDEASSVVCICDAGETKKCKWTGHQRYCNHISETWTQSVESCADLCEENESCSKALYGSMNFGDWRNGRCYLYDENGIECGDSEDPNWKSITCRSDLAEPPRSCGRIYSHAVDDPRRLHWANVAIFDGAKLGMAHLMHKWVDNDELSSIFVEYGCSITIWEDTNESGDSFTCRGDTPGGRTCDSNGLGDVGNDETSTVTCRC